jgi:hypothetical protein
VPQEAENIGSSSTEVEEVMKAIIDIPVDGDKCGSCVLSVWNGGPNGWAWICPLFEERLTQRYWKSDNGWKKTRMLKTETLTRCQGCLAATKTFAELEEKHLKAEIIRYAAGDETCPSK